MDALVKMLTAQVDYELTHRDALAGYSHLPRAGSWDYYNRREALEAYVAENYPKWVGNMDRLEYAVLDGLTLYRTQRTTEQGRFAAPVLFDVQYISELKLAFPIDELELHIPEEYAKTAEARLAHSDFTYNAGYAYYYVGDTASLGWCAAVAAITVEAFEALLEEYAAEAEEAEEYEEYEEYEYADEDDEDESTA